MVERPAPNIIDATRPLMARALAHPTRHQLLTAIDENGATISQLANRLLINKGNVAHHLGVLVEAGLVRKGRTRTVRGGTEQYYLRVATPMMFKDGPDGAATLAMIDNIGRAIVRDQNALLNHRVLRLTERQAAALAQHLDALVNDLVPAGDRERRHAVVVGVYRYT